MNNNIDSNPTSHAEAMKGQMAEHFALGTLNPEDRARFEAHFFDCNDCFENVRIASEFLQHSRRVLSRDPEKGAFARFFADLRRSATVIMALLFLVTVGFGVQQHIEVTHLQAPVQGQVTYLYEKTRSPGKEEIINVTRGVGTSLKVGFPSQDEFKSYRALILSEPDKKVLYTVPLVVERDDSSAMIIFPPETLRDGTYSILIQGTLGDGSWKSLLDGKREAGGVFHYLGHGT
jgi:hypothetical protein